MNNIYENPAAGMIVDSSSIKCAAKNFQKLFEDKTELSESFIQRWRERYNVKSYYVAGHSSSADFKSFENWKKTVFESVIEKYDAANIYNVDESGFFLFNFFFSHIFFRNPFFFFFIFEVVFFNYLISFF
jgi:hypothetical protein